MTDYTKPTGSTGTMMIRDTGTLVEFWLKAGSGTFNYDLPWAYVVNGVTSSWREFRFVEGGAWQKISSWNVTYSQTVTFKLGDTGTSGLGGPTNFSQAINRATVPAVPSTPALSSISSTSVFVSFSDGANGGAAIDSRQIGYGTNGTTPSSIIGSDGSDNVTGLTPGTTYYFWARTHNSRGYSSWSARAEATTHRIPDIPSPPSVSNVGPTSAVISWAPPNNNGGTPITSYEVGISTSSAPPGSGVEASSPYTRSGLIPGTTYYARVSARNAVGQSDWSAPTPFQTIAGVRVKVGDVSSGSPLWRIAIPYVKVGGVWVLVRPWVKNAGVWKETI